MATNYKPKEGDLQVWWVPQIPMDGFRIPVDSPEQAKFILAVLGEYDLFQYDHRVKPDYSNAGGLEIFRNGEWEEWESHDYDDIDAWKPGLAEKIGLGIREATEVGASSREGKEG